MFNFHSPAAIAVLPRAPRNASPVPGLTSLYHKLYRGPYGNPAYPGNCSGELIKDLLKYFQPGLVFDPMTGSGTCKDVCTELDIPCISDDIRNGFDACDPAEYSDMLLRFDFIWIHPPYWRQKHYTDDPRDMSNAKCLYDFAEQYRRLIENCASVLAPNGKLAILMGDYEDREVGFVPLVYHTQRLAFEENLMQHGTQIIRFSYGASSSKKSYRSKFIPGLHDVCTIFEKA
ncbi:MAG TPA: hypothetical protein VFE46_13410 [Pirellulales bacterium]|nr:hypothetical protein [Pirellulales bacterium]